MKPTHGERRFVAHRKFTDRDDARAVFQTALDTEQPHDAYRVLHWNGVGGQGKSALLKEFERMAHQARQKMREQASPFHLCTARVSLETPRMQRPEEALLSIRLQLAKDQRITFGAFDTAFARYFTRTNPGVDMRARHSELFGTDNQIAGDLLSWGGSSAAGLATAASDLLLPGVGLLIKHVRNLPQHAREWWDRRGKNVLTGLDQLTDDELLARLPTYLGADVCDAMTQDPRLRPIVMLDAHERLWEQQSDARSAPRRDAWVRLLVQDAPGTLVVIMSRDKLIWPSLDADKWANVVDDHRLGPLSDDDADQFLRTVPIEDETIRSVIIAGAQGLPFYLDIQVEDYENLIEADRAPCADDFERSHPDILNQFLDHLPNSEERVLSLASYLPELTETRLIELATTFLGGAAHVNWTRFAERSFVVGTDGDRVTLHALLREELQQRERKERPGLYEQIHRSLFEAADARIEPKDGTPVNAENEAAYLEALHHRTQFELGTLLEWLLSRQNPFERAARWQLMERVYENGLSAARTTLGEEHLDTLTTRANLAEQIGNLGRYAEAEEEFRSIWTIRRRLEVLGDEHPDTLTARHNLAHQIGSQGRYAEAEAELRAVWTIQRRLEVLGEEHLDTLTTRANLAAQIGYQGRCVEAEAEFHAIWTIRRRPEMLGEEHPSTLIARHNFAQQISNQNRYAEAEAEFRAIWMIRRRLKELGEEHPDTLMARHSLAHCIGSQGRYAEAEAELRAIWTIQRRPEVLGEEHPNTLATRHNLAHQIVNQGRYPEAEAELRIIWTIQRHPKVLGEEHPHSLRTRFNLLRVLEKQAKAWEANTLLEGLEESYLKSLPATHPWIKELHDRSKW